MSYWIAALLLVAFGFITGFSIGPPFLLVGLVLLALGPLRRWPRVYWPPLVGVVALIIGGVVFAPLTCTATADAGGLSQTVCTSILGPTWSGSGLYNPPPDAFALAFRVGLGAGVVAAIMTFVWLTIRRQRPRGAGREDGHQGSSSL